MTRKELKEYLSITNCYHDHGNREQYDKEIKDFFIRHPHLNQTYHTPMTIHRLDMTQEQRDKGSRAFWKNIGEQQIKARKFSRK